MARGLYEDGMVLILGFDYDVISWDFYWHDSADPVHIQVSESSSIHLYLPTTDTPILLTPPLSGFGIFLGQIWSTYFTSWQVSCCFRTLPSNHHGFLTTFCFVWNSTSQDPVI